VSEMIRSQRYPCRQSPSLSNKRRRNGAKCLHIGEKNLPYQFWHDPQTVYNCRQSPSLSNKRKGRMQNELSVRFCEGEFQDILTTDISLLYPIFRNVKQNFIKISVYDICGHFSPLCSLIQAQRLFFYISAKKNSDISLQTSETPAL